MIKTNICTEFEIYKDKELASLDHNQCDNLIIKECPYHKNCAFTNTLLGLKKLMKLYRSSLSSPGYRALFTDTCFIDLLCEHRDLKLEKMYIGESNLKLYQIVQEEPEEELSKSEKDIESELINGKSQFHFMKPENAVLVGAHKYIGNDNRIDCINSQIQSDINNIDLNTNPYGKANDLLICPLMDYINKILRFSNVCLLHNQTKAAKKKLCMNVSVFKIPEPHDNYEPKSLYNISADKINNQKYSNELLRKFPTRMLIEDNYNKKVKLLTKQEADVDKLLINSVDINIEEHMGWGFKFMEEISSCILEPDNNMKKFLLETNKKLLQYPDLKVGYSISLYVTD